MSVEEQTDTRMATPQELGIESGDSAAHTEASPVQYERWSGGGHAAQKPIEDDNGGYVNGLAHTISFQEAERIMRETGLVATREQLEAAVMARSAEWENVPAYIPPTESLLPSPPADESEAQLAPVERQRRFGRPLAIIGGLALSGIMLLSLNGLRQDGAPEGGDRTELSTTSSTLASETTTTTLAITTTTATTVKPAATVPGAKPNAPAPTNKSPVYGQNPLLVSSNPQHRPLPPRDRPFRNLRLPRPYRPSLTQMVRRHLARRQRQGDLATNEITGDPHVSFYE